MNILTVCIGNICRSPMAELLLRAELPSEFSVTSAGTYGGHHGEPMHRQAAAQMLSRGLDPSDFRARRLRREYVDEADLVLAATADVRGEIVSGHPAAMRKTFTMLEFASLVETAPEGDLIAHAVANRGAVSGALDIADPYGHSDQHFAEAADLIADAAKRIAFGLSS